MPEIVLETPVAAPRERVYDLARSVDIHTASMADHGERAVDGVTDGLLSAGDRVTWRARHFGVPLELEATVTAAERPEHFRDEQVDGPFASMVHDHEFEETPGGTRMHDRFAYTSPLGPLGRVVDAVILEEYMRRTLRSRADHLKRVAEGDDWQRYLADDD